MQNGRIRLTQLSASSSWDANHGPRNGRLNFRRTGSRMGAWCARRNDRYQYYQVDFRRAMRVVKIATQGRQDAAQWVTQYFVTYSQDGNSFAEYKENSNRKVVPSDSSLVIYIMQLSLFPNFSFYVIYQMERPCLTTFPIGAQWSIFDDRRVLDISSRSKLKLRGKGRNKMTKNPR